jgi:hypothetical protein
MGNLDLLLDFLQDPLSELSQRRTIDQLSQFTVTVYCVFSVRLALAIGAVLRECATAVEYDRAYVHGIVHGSHVHTQCVSSRGYSLFVQ